MNPMREFVMEKIGGKKSRLDERIVMMGTEFGGEIRVAVNPSRLEMQSLMSEGVGLRILVGADEFSDQVLAWAGDGNSNVGAMHETIGDQVGMVLYGNRHVPLEVNPQGKIFVTTTAQGMDFEDARDVEDVLDRNRMWGRVHQRALNSARIDYTNIDQY